MGSHLLSILLVALLSVTYAVAFSCKDYSGDSASTEFCQKTACTSYCSTHNIPHYCMDHHYVEKGYCEQVGGFPDGKCTVVTGIKKEHVHWCQTVACDYSVKACAENGGSNCQSSIGGSIVKEFPQYCKAIGKQGGGTVSKPVDKKPADKKPADKTPGGTDTKPPKKRPIPPKKKEKKKPDTIVTPPVKTTKPPKQVEPEDPSEVGGCWAAKGWTGSDPCVKCASPQAEKCPLYSWTDCFDSKRECEKKNSGGGGGGGGGAAAGGGGFCKNECVADTTGLRRPKFRGPSCYVPNEFGAQFGPNWKPSGKTRWEHYVPDPTALHKLVSIFGGNQADTPVLGSSPKLDDEEVWGLSGCNAAAAVHENIVCAIELIEARGVKFEGPKNNPGAGYSISDFADTGDEELDRAELAAFIGHKFKETARLTAWVENTADTYRLCTIWPCADGKSYNGRGPVQISWNYNYGPLSEWFYGDKMVLINDPDMVDPQGPMGFIAAIWFWMTPRGFNRGEIRTRDAIVHWTDGKMNSIYKDGNDYDKIAGFGLTTHVINGGIECGSNLGTDHHVWRVAYYLTVASRLGVPIPDDETLNDWDKCKNDKLCSGLFSGCGAYNIATYRGNLKCGSPQTTTCGKQWTDPGLWTVKHCSAT